jgi:hypothetical protein
VISSAMPAPIAPPGIGDVPLNPSHAVRFSAPVMVA